MKIFYFLWLFTFSLKGFCQDSQRSPFWCDNTYISPKVCWEFIDVNCRHITHNNLLGITDDDTLDGVLCGFDAGFIYKVCGGAYVQLDFSYAGGKLHGNKSKGRFVHYAEYEGLYGCYYATPSVDLIPFVGIAYDYHKQNLREKSHHGKKLSLIYHIFSVPIGLKFNFYSQPFFELGLLLKVMPQIHSKLTSKHFSHRRLKLKNTVGYYVEVPLTWNTYCDCYVWKFIITPYWKQFSYGKSESERKKIIKVTTPKETINDFGLTLTAGTLF